MPHPLDGCRAKIATADENIDNFVPELDAFVAAHYDRYRALLRGKGVRTSMLTADSAKSAAWPTTEKP
jgi:hypothetical protein